MDALCPGGQVLGRGSFPITPPGLTKIHVFRAGAEMQLEHYEKILENVEEANYLKAKRYKVNFDVKMGVQKLWEIHDAAIEEFKKGKVSSEGRHTLLELKQELAFTILSSCELCEHRCRANRKAGKKGFCGVLQPRIASEFLHFGEEPMLVPSHTIFFAGCTFHCIFCQNWDISQFPENGIIAGAGDVASCIKSRHTVSLNVNWVGGEPTPNLPFVLETLSLLDVNVHQIWNSNMYMSTETMKLLDGIIDVYLADFKYGNDRCAEKLSGVKNYVEVVLRNHKIANSQCDVLIRHLVMPGHVECCSLPMLELIDRELEKKNLVINIMDQYRPEYKASQMPEINRYITKKEYFTVLNHAKKLGFTIV
ncbi:MAG: radical SAM protein [Thermoplasmata archaeon]